MLQRRGDFFPLRQISKIYVTLLFQEALERQQCITMIEFFWWHILTHLLFWQDEYYVELEG